MFLDPTDDPQRSSRPYGASVALPVASQQLAGLRLVAVGEGDEQLGDDVGELGDASVEPSVLVHGVLQVADPAGSEARASCRKPRGGSVTSVLMGPPGR